MRFKGCTFAGDPATTHGLSAGEIQVNALKGRLGYINKVGHEVGVILEPTTAGGAFAEFEVLEGNLMSTLASATPPKGPSTKKAVLLANRTATMA